MNKRKIFLCFLLLLALFLPCASFSKELTVTPFNITVPVNLPISVLSDGSVITSNHCFVVNQNSYDVIISDIRIETLNGWSLYSMEALPMDYVGEKAFSLEIKSPSPGDLIPQNQKIQIDYSAIIAPQTNAIQEGIARCVFIVNPLVTTKNDTTQEKFNINTQQDTITSGFISVQKDNSSATISDQVKIEDPNVFGDSQVSSVIDINEKTRAPG